MENAPPSLGTDIFMPKDDSFQAPDNEMDKVDKEIEEILLHKQGTSIPS